jgi:hypothetical protein
MLYGWLSSMLSPNSKSSTFRCLGRQGSCPLALRTTCSALHSTNCALTISCRIHSSPFISSQASLPLLWEFSCFRRVVRISYASSTTSSPASLQLIHNTCTLNLASVLFSVSIHEEQFLRPLYPGPFQSASTTIWLDASSHSNIHNKRISPLRPLPSSNAPGQPSLLGSFQYYLRCISISCYILCPQSTSLPCSDAPPPPSPSPRRTSSSGRLVANASFTRPRRSSQLK